jgi:uncharacterized protein (DUF885 family)
MKYPLVHFVAALLLALSSSSLLAATADQQLEELMNRFWQAELDAMPLTANLYGSLVHRDKVNDLSDEAYLARKKRLHAAIEEMKAIEVAVLSKANQVNYEVFEWMLRHESKTLDFDWRYITLNTLGGVDVPYFSVPDPELV